MILRFGLELQEQVYPQWEMQAGQPVLACGERGLMLHLEQQLGLLYPDLQDYLRNEQYRQLMQAYLQLNPTAFYAASFEADALGTAEVLLARRDELYLAGWDFAPVAAMPLRLQTLAELEALLQSGQILRLQAGRAERWRSIATLLETYAETPFKCIYLNEPLALLPPHLQGILARLAELGCELLPAETPQPAQPPGSLLEAWQLALQRQPLDKDQLGTKADGSLWILRAGSEQDLAVFMGQLLRKNPQYRPVCVIAGKNRSLDQALSEEGLPSMGLPSASLARPTLQILRLATAFLWKPVDPFKILEFASLPNKPLDEGLSRVIAGLVAQKPGMFSAAWTAAVKGYFERQERFIGLQDNPKRRKELEDELEQAQFQYRFWFMRRRYEQNQAAPAKDIIELFDYLRRWAGQQSEDKKNEMDKLDKRLATNNGEQETLLKQREELAKALSPLQALCNQAGRIVEVLHALPPGEQQLNALQLERLVRSFNEPTALQWQETQSGHLPFVFHSAAITRPADKVLWWNFVEDQAPVGFARWYPRERDYLQALGLKLELPETENRRRLWQRNRAILLCREQLILCLPQTIQGQSAQAHPLLGELEAALGEERLKACTVNIQKPEERERLLNLFQLPKRQSLQALCLQRSRPYINLKGGYAMQTQEQESHSSLEQLLYYPYQWVFRYQIELNQSPILRVTKDETLMGNLSHLVFEHLLDEVKESGTRRWNEAEVYRWVDEYMPELFEREGAVLLLYGEEPRRIHFQKKVKQAAWQLVAAIQRNGWQIVGTEHPLQGQLAEQKIKGIADLVLRRGKETAVVDIKWAGLSKRLNQLKNGEDLQLVLYSRMAAAEDEDWAHTAYFIVNEARFLARDRQAFKEAQVPPGEILDFRELHRQVWQRMESTFLWRCRQLAKGRIEVCTNHTKQEISQSILEELSAHELQMLLEMEGRENARFDPFRVLVQPLTD